ncbi:MULTISPECIES: hypothetical protein [unclassified Moorena]|uniref:hypothetical protein n=1 Tax=unclassified Moorena TaxID=2683338 RepID=UPI0013B73877|nr:MULTISPECIES: hypothetical protein [unclassified Moorena]NER87487.1 hypothetical protein [Moorena sp. SIO3A2]
MRFDPVGAMGILVPWASWWNRHLTGMGILLAWASWWNGHLGAMGILVERASCPFPAATVSIQLIRYLRCYLRCQRPTADS